MKKRVHKWASYALTGFAAACTFAALPVISHTASVDIERDAARMDAFQAYLDSPIAITDEAGLLTQSFAERDSLLISDLQPFDVSLVQRSKAKAKARHCLTEAIYYEARSETRSGQKAVGEVVLNRVKSKHFPNSVCGVVYEGAERNTGCQFSFVCDGSRDKALEPKAWERSQRVADHLLTGMHRPITNRATHYHTTYVNPVWAPNLRATRDIGDHKFYRFKSRRELAYAGNVAP